MLIDRRLDASSFIMYVIAQVTGAVLASLVLLSAFSKAFVASTATIPNAILGVSDMDAFLLELMGTSVNPARTLGPALVGGESTSLWVYMVAPMVGSFIGWAVYKLVTSGEGGES